jgi:glutaconate CoA-transferase, subunit A
VLCARRSLVTVEERVDQLDARTRVVLPSWVVDAVSVVPQGAHPSYAAGYSERDNGFYARWDAISRDRAPFVEWMRRHVLEAPDFGAHLRLLAAETAAVGSR